MAPPVKVQPTPSPNLPAKTATEEREEYLADLALVGDPRWKDSSFSQNHMEVYFAVDAVQRFMKGEGGMSSERLAAKIKTLLDSETEENKEFHQTVVKSFYRQLTSFQDPENVTRAREIMALLPDGVPAPPPAPEESKKDPKTEPAKVEEPQDHFTPGWRFNAATFDFHASDETFRGFPRIYTATILPEEGLGQNLSSDFGGVAAAEFGYNDLNFLAGAYYEDLTPTQNPAHYQRAGIRLGMVEYGGLGVGDRGPGGKFHLTLLGRSKNAFEIGAVWCTGIDGSEVSGVSCPGASPQLGVSRSTSFLSFGYGPFEAGLSLMPLKVYLQNEEQALPESNRLPIEFNVAWNFSNLESPYAPQTSEEVLTKKVSNGQVATTAWKLGTTTFINNFGRKQEAALQLTRVLFLGNQAQYSLANTGTFVFGLLNGYSEGSLGYSLGRDLHYGNTGQRAVLGSLMGAELLAHLIGFAATPGTPDPDEIQTFPGQQVPDDYDTSANEGLTNLQARAFRLNLPQIAVRDGLAVLGAVGAFGDRNKAVKGDSVVYPITHSVMTLGGVVMALTSGDGSGTGFFGHSVMGNQLPNEAVIQLEDSRFSLENQSLQYFRVEAGGQLLGFGINGIVDFAAGRYKYLKFKHCESEEGKSDPSCGDKEKVEEKKNTAMVQDLRVNAQLGQDGGMLTVGGKF